MRPSSSTTSRRATSGPSSGDRSSGDRSTTRRGSTEVFARHRVDAVIHFAASALVGESMTDPGKYFRNNALGTLNLIEAMRAAGVGTIVFSSTCATYGNPVRVPIDEGHPQVPVNPYGESKLMVEKMLRWYGECHDLRWMALRYFNAAGADPEGEIGEDHDPESHLIPLVIGGVLGTRRPVKVFGTDYPTAGRHGHSRLHPRRRSRRRAPACDRAPRRGNSEPGDQSGHRCRPFRAACHRHGRRGEWTARALRPGAAARRRSAGACGRSRSRPRRARLDAALRRI